MYLLWSSVVPALLQLLVQPPGQRPQDISRDNQRHAGITKLDYIYTKLRHGALHLDANIALLLQPAMMLQKPETSKIRHAIDVRSP
ncbi:hypothetical protein Tco_0879906 [Tanacetum coccineum]